MAKNKNGDSEPPADPNARLVTSKEDKLKAKKWFDRARELGDKRQFDYAIEYYVNGLEYWPNAVEEACKPLHGCAVARRQTGGKKPGIRDSMKHSMNDKDPKKAFLNAAWLFGHDPDNADYLEGMAKTANRLRAEDAALWACGLCRKTLEGSAKTNAKQYLALAGLFEEIGERAAARDDAALGVEAFNSGVQLLHTLRARVSKDRTVENSLRDLSTKLTILKGKYQEGESFRDSIQDKETQRVLHDEERTMQADERVEQLIAQADQAFREAPDDARTLSRLVDLLCRRENEEDELRAIGLLVAQFKRTSDYRHKHNADDIRMKQLGRKVRQATKAGDEAAAKEAQVASLRFDLGVFKERVERYPTDNRVKFEYGVRLFKAGRFDDAIPAFQAARTDPKNRSACGLYLGRCFFRKGYFTQAITALKSEIEAHEHSDDDLAKGLLYWLGRSYEAAKDAKKAEQVYGEILQLDYNYKDVRARMDGLSSAD